MVTRVEDNLRQMKANLMNWVLGALRWALFFQAHRDSSWKACPSGSSFRGRAAQCGRPSLTSTVASPLLVRSLGLTPPLLVRFLRLTPPFLVRPRTRLTPPLLVRFLRLTPPFLVRFLRPVSTRRELRGRRNVHCSAMPEAKELVRHRYAAQIDVGKCSTVLVGPHWAVFQTDTPTLKPILEERAGRLSTWLGRSASGMLYFRRIYTDQSHAANATNDDSVAVDHSIDCLRFGK